MREQAEANPQNMQARGDGNKAQTVGRTGSRRGHFRAMRIAVKQRKRADQQRARRQRPRLLGKPRAAG